MVRLLSSALIVVAAALPCACGGKTPPANLTADDAASDVSLRIVSRNSRDVVVYLYTGSRIADDPEDSRPVESAGFNRYATAPRKQTNVAARQRLGMAAGHSTTEFKLPWSRVSGHSQIHLLAERIGDDTEIWSEPVHIAAGGTVVWTLELELGNSTTSVY